MSIEPPDKHQFSSEPGFLVADDEQRGLSMRSHVPVDYNGATEYRDPIQEATGNGYGYTMADLWEGSTYVFGAGTVTRPSVAVGENDSGLYSIAAGNVGLTIDGVLVSDWNATRQRLNTTISLQFGDDVSLSRGAANRLDLATGDDFNIVLGAFQIGATTVFESDRDLAVSLIPNADNALTIGSSARRFSTINFGTSLNWFGSVGAANPVFVVGDDGAGNVSVSFGLGGASAVDITLLRGAADRLDLASGDSLNLLSGSVTANTLNLKNSTLQIVLDSDAAVNTGTITMAALTAARTWTLQDATGTIYQTGGTDVAIADGGTNSSAALSNNRIIVSSGGAIVEAGAMTNGQLLIGSTGAAPVVASLTAGANITITPGAGSITIAATAGGGNTLDQSYDQGGAGAGRTITVDSGAVQLTAGGTTVGGFTMDGSRTIASAAGAIWNEMLIDADVSLSGSTNVTTATGFNMVTLNRPIITDAGTITSITNAATFYIGGDPVPSGLTITNGYALWVDAGVTRLDGQAQGADGTAAAPQWSFASDPNTGMYSVAADNMAISVGGVARLQIGSTFYTINQGVATSGSSAKWLYNAGAHTSLSTGLEVVDVHWDLSRVVQHAAGNYATQRAFVIEEPTYSFTSASTITDAATFAVRAQPTAGTNATLTNSYAVWVQAGRIAADGGILIGAEPTGVSGKVGYTNTVDNSANNIGIGTILMKGATSRNTSGFLKILDGTTARYVPYFDAITG